MRIISGKHKNRVIPTSKKANYRPSTSKFREAIFSILSSGDFGDKSAIKGAIVLDLFSGSGILSFEAISRGAARATLVDNNPDHIKAIRKFAEKLGEKDNITTFIAEATTWRSFSDKFTLVFIDPPYKTEYFKTVLDNLHLNNSLAEEANIVIEMSKYDNLPEVSNFSVLKEKIYNNNKLLILGYEQGKK